MDPDLEGFLKQFDRIHQEATWLTRNLKARDLLWRPRPNKWSIAEFLAHLAVVDGKELPQLRSTIEQARGQGIMGRGPFHYGMWSGLFVKYLARAPATEAPNVKDPEQAIGEFQRVQGQLRQLVREANGLDLSRIKMRLSHTPVLKLSLGQRFQLLAERDRRHLSRARKVLRAMSAR